MSEASATGLTVSDAPIRYGKLVDTARIDPEVPDGLPWVAKRSARAAEDQVANHEFLASRGL